MSLKNEHNTLGHGGSFMLALLFSLFLNPHFLEASARTLGRRDKIGKGGTGKHQRFFILLAIVQHQEAG